MSGSFWFCVAWHFIINVRTPHTRPKKKKEKRREYNINMIETTKISGIQSVYGNSLCWWHHKGRTKCAFFFFGYKTSSAIDIHIILQYDVYGDRLVATASLCLRFPQNAINPACYVVECHTLWAFQMTADESNAKFLPIMNPSLSIKLTGKMPSIGDAAFRDSNNFFW